MMTSLCSRVLALLFFDGHARPVANILAGACQVVEHRRLAAVRVAGKRNANSHCLPFSRLRICQPEISLQKNPPGDERFVSYRKLAFLKMAPLRPILAN